MNRLLARNIRLNRSIIFALVLFWAILLSPVFVSSANADWPTDEKYPGTLLWPVDTSYRYVSSPVGMRNGRRHNGTDIAGMPKLVPVVAAESGTAYRKWYGGYGSGSGNYILIDHHNGYYTRYCHLAGYANCLKNSENAAAEVTKGQVIGYVGLTGGTTGTHLHFEILHYSKGAGYASSYDGSTNWVALKGAATGTNSTKYQSFTYQSVSSGSDISDLEIRNVYYPKTYVIGKGFNLQGGIVCSKNGLKTLKVQIVDAQNNVISHMENMTNDTMSISGKAFDIQDLDGKGEDRGQRFSKITSAGDYKWIIEATDQAGGKVTLTIPFKAVTSGNNVCKHMSSFNQPTDVSYTVVEDNINAYYTVKGFSPDPSASGIGFAIPQLYGGAATLPTYKSPDSSSSIISNKSVVSYYFVKKSVRTKSNVLWYLLEDNSYIQADKLNSEAEFRPATNVQTGIYKANIKTQWGKAPFDAHDRGTDIQKGENVEVVSAVVNKYNNTWYEIAPVNSGKWIYSGHFDFDGSIPTLSISGQTAPSGQRKKGNGMELYGTISSNENIVSVTGAIYNQKTGGLPSFSTKKNPATITPNAKSVNINTFKISGSSLTINTSLKLGELPVGSYRYELKATTSSGYTAVLIDSYFSVYDDEPSMGDEPIVYATSLDTNATSIELISGESYRLVASVQPEGKVTNPAVTWSSSNSSVATVDSTGMVYAVSAGSATITVVTTDGSALSKQIAVTVRNAQTVISLKNQTSFEVGKHEQLVASTSTGCSVSWSTSDSNVARVLSDGTVYGMKPGSAIITATADDDNSSYAQCKVIITEPQWPLEMNVNNQLNFPVNEYNGFAVVRFIPTTTDQYEFYSIGETDTYAILYDSHWNEICRDDDSGDNTNFRIVTNYDAYETYYLVARGYSLNASAFVISIICNHPIDQINENVITSVSINEAGVYKYFRFVPSESEIYAFYSRGEKDTLGYVYDSDWNLLVSDDDGGDRYNFFAKCYLTAGQTYYVVTGLYSNTGSYTVAIEKNKPVTYLSFSTTELEPGEFGYLERYICYTTNYSEASNQGIRCEPLESDVADVSSNGFVQAKSNGQVYVKVYSLEDPTISNYALIYVHDKISYSYDVSVDSSGTICLTFTGLPNQTDKINGFQLYEMNYEELELVSASLPGATNIPVVASSDVWGRDFDQIFSVFTQSRENLIDADEKVVFRLRPIDMSSLWGTSHSYSFMFYPYYYRGISDSVEKAKLVFDFTVTFPEFDFVIPISEGEDALVNVRSPGAGKTYGFVPETTGAYAFYSDGDQDTVGWFYSSQWEQLAYDEYSGENNNFFATYNLVAGQKYFLSTRLKSETATGKYSVKVVKHIPVAYIDCGAHDLMPGESETSYVYLYTSDWTTPTNQAYYFDPVDDEICSVSQDGYVVAKKNGLSSVTVHSKENPQISRSVPIYVHDLMQFSCDASTNTNGTVILEFNCNAASVNYFGGYEIIFEELDSWFDVMRCEVTNHEVTTDNYTWDGGQGINLGEKNKNNNISTTEKVKFYLLPKDVSTLWGKTKQYTFRLGVLMNFDGDLWSMSDVSNRNLFNVTISFPQEPTSSPLTSADLVLPSALKTIDDEAFCNVSARSVNLPDGLTSIGNKAFAQCMNLSIYIPESCTSIAANAFDRDSGVIIYGFRGSYAETYAYQYGYAFTPVD